MKQLRPGALVTPLDHGLLDRRPAQELGGIALDQGLMELTAQVGPDVDHVGERGAEGGGLSSHPVHQSRLQRDVTE